MHTEWEYGWKLFLIPKTGDTDTRLIFPQFLDLYVYHSRNVKDIVHPGSKSSLHAMNVRDKQDFPESALKCEQQLNHN